MDLRFVHSNTCYILKNYLQKKEEWGLLTNWEYLGGGCTHSH